MTGTQPSEADGAIRVLLADDDAYTDSLRALIERQPELHVVGAARDGLEAIERDAGANAVLRKTELLDGLIERLARLRQPA